MPKPELDFLIVTTAGTGRRVNIQLFNKRQLPALGLLSTPHKTPNAQLVSMTSALNSPRDGFYALRVAESDYVVLQSAQGQVQRVEIREVPELPPDRWARFMHLQDGDYVNAVAVYKR